MAQEHCYAVAEVYYIICVWCLSVAAPAINLGGADYFVNFIF